jgi:glycosyltransferase involved in cell wall biosynthesis
MATDQSKIQKILVITSDVPFVRGGHRIIAENTVQALIDHKYIAELHYTPQNRFGRQLSGYMVNRFSDFNYTEDGKGVDRIIAMRYPSYVVQHPNKVVWLVHRMREYYDLWDEYKKTLSIQGRVKETARRSIIHFLDHYYLTRGVNKIYTISGQVKERLRIWGGIDAEVLYPPVTPGNWHCREYGNYFLCVSRLMKHKRIDLFVKAAAFVKNRNIRFVIAGSGPEENNLKKLISNLKLTSRFELTGQVEQQRLIDLYASSRGVVFVPLREEFGFVTLEAFRSDKPVITAADSGGPTELIKDSKSGYITCAIPEAIAEKMDLLANDDSLAAELGTEGNRMTSYINWETTVRKLVKP